MINTIHTIREEWIVHEDDSIIVIRKSAGLAVESARVTEPDLISLLKTYLGGSVFMVHRLDQVVEGLVVFAKSRTAAAKLTEELARGEMSKKYIARVSGVIPADEGTLTDYLIKDGRTNCSRIADKGERGAKKAVLKFKKIREDEVAIELLTGRHHQIRVQLSHAGMPVRGDVKYGAPAGERCGRRAGIDLCAAELSFLHPSSGRRVTYRTEPGFM
ncbi:MAG: RluA family pseudouridine synthase [Lachnospiraceae bacterium]|nr:RluA family pseudouridine synthase [Lachnospiraceae bacterium]